MTNNHPYMQTDIYLFVYLFVQIFLVRALDLALSLTPTMTVDVAELLFCSYFTLRSRSCLSKGLWF